MRARLLRSRAPHGNVPNLAPSPTPTPTGRMSALFLVTGPSPEERGRWREVLSLELKNLESEYGTLMYGGLATTQVRQGGRARGRRRRGRHWGREKPCAGERCGLVAGAMCPGLRMWTRWRG